MRKKLLLLALLFVFSMKAWPIEFIYDGDKVKLEETIEWAKNEANQIITSNLVDSIHRDALVSSIAIDKLQKDSKFRGIIYTDKDVNDIDAFGKFIWKKPVNLLEPVGHKYVGSTAKAYKVKMVRNRAKILFSDDGPTNWNIPKAKQNPSRKYTLKIR